MNDEALAPTGLCRIKFGSFMIGPRGHLCMESGEGVFVRVEIMCFEDFGAVIVGSPRFKEVASKIRVDFSDAESLDERRVLAAKRAILDRWR
ncbi:MAG: hypothetical protein ABEH81_16250 [Halopenitus sp.]